MQVPVQSATTSAAAASESAPVAVVVLTIPVPNVAQFWLEVPRVKVAVLATPVPPLAEGSKPVTPVLRGNPVALISPIVGLVANTKFPVPVAPVGVTPPIEILVPKVCNAVHVLALLSAREATTDPVVGVMVRVPSELITELTDPEPLPQDAPVFDTKPVVGLICRQ